MGRRRQSTRRIIQQLQRAIERHVRLLGLEAWRIEVRFIKGLESDGQQLTGACEARHRYQDATLYFDPQRVAEQHENINELVRHEMLHILTAGLAELADRWAGAEPTRQMLVEETHERLVTMLERLPAWNSCKMR